VSGLLPRTDDDLAFERVVRINSGLEDMCKDMKIDFVDNMPVFMLKNGHINHEYLDSKGLHLSRKGTERLIENLKLQDKVKYADHRRMKASTTPASGTQKQDSGTDKTHQTPFSRRVKLPTKNVYYFAGKNSNLSNFKHMHFKAFGRVFHHLEGAYHYQKGIEHEMFGLANDIANIWNPVSAMYKGRDITTRPTWYWLKAGYMMKLLYMKADQSPEFVDELLGTGDAFIVENTVHPFWGRGTDDYGLGVLGYLLMDLRADLRSRLSPYQKAYPALVTRGPSHSQALQTQRPSTTMTPQTVPTIGQPAVAPYSAPVSVPSIGLQQQSSPSTMNHQMSSSAMQQHFAPSTGPSMSAVNPAQYPPVPNTVQQQQFAPNSSHYASVPNTRHHPQNLINARSVSQQPAYGYHPTVPSTTQHPVDTGNQPTLEMSTGQQPLGPVCMNQQPAINTAHQTSAHNTRHHPQNLSNARSVSQQPAYGYHPTVPSTAQHPVGTGNQQSYYGTAQQPSPQQQNNNSAFWGPGSGSGQTWTPPYPLIPPLGPHQSTSSPTTVKLPQTHNHTVQTHSGNDSCWYCGEDGHVTTSCRHGKPIQCTLCNEWGHKRKCHESSFY
jgi:predicted NAD-dependent protein-ADP-ribosyltransferase YbiA (DUF1768 family)